MEVLEFKTLVRGASHISEGWKAYILNHLQSHPEKYSAGKRAEIARKIQEIEGRYPPSTN